VKEGRGKREKGEEGGVRVCVLPGPFLTKNTARIELIGTAERAVTAESEALETCRLSRCSLYVVVIGNMYTCIYGN